MFVSESESEHKVPSTKVPSTKVLGIWIDPVTKVSGHIDQSTPAKVGQTVRFLTKRVIAQVNEEYSFDPPLKRNEMLVDCYAGKIYLLYLIQL
jgi:hypothetical protein